MASLTLLTVNYGIPLHTLQVDLPSPQLMLAGAIVGLMLGGPLITFMLTGRHRWLAIMALNACYIVAFVIGGWQAAVAAVTASVLAILVSAALFRHSFDESTWDAFSYEIKLALGRTKDLQVIEEGKTVLPKDGGQLFGPRTIVVKPNNAVILERGSKQTRVSGPAMIMTEPFEYVRRIFDLRPRQERLSIGRIMTPDLLALDVVVDVTYRIDIPDEMRLGSKDFGEWQKLVIREIDLRVPEWEQATRNVIEGFVRQLVSSMDMLEMLKPAAAQRFEQRILRLSDDRCNREWHVRVDSLVLERVQPVSETAIHMNERAKAATQRDALRLMADGYKQARDRGMTDDEIQYAVLRHTLEQIAKDSNTELFLTPELLDLFSIVRKGRNGQNASQGPKS